MRDISELRVVSSREREKGNSEKERGGDEMNQDNLVVCESDLLVVNYMVT